MKRRGSHTVRRAWDATGNQATAEGLEGRVCYVSNASGTVNVVGGATDEPLGIISAVGPDNLTVDVVLPGGVVNARYGDTVAANGHLLMADATGRLITYVTAAGNYSAAKHLVGGQLLVGEMAEVLVRSDVDHTDAGSV